MSRTVIDLAKLHERATEFNAHLREAAIARRVERRREDERLTEHDRHLVHCHYCDTWLYTGERNTKNRRIQPHRKSLAGHYHHAHPEVLNELLKTVA